MTLNENVRQRPFLLVSMVDPTSKSTMIAVSAPSYINHLEHGNSYFTHNCNIHLSPVSPGQGIGKGLVLRREQSGGRSKQYNLQTQRKIQTGLVKLQMYLGSGTILAVAEISSFFFESYFCVILEKANISRCTFIEYDMIMRCQ